MSGQDARVTRRSRDDGIDGVVFDCSATLGGEFIVQAKRYRNVVPANDVRALAGVIRQAGEPRTLRDLIMVQRRRPTVRPRQPRTADRRARAPSLAPGASRPGRPHPIFAPSPSCRLTRDCALRSLSVISLRARRNRGPRVPRGARPLIVHVASNTSPSVRHESKDEPLSCVNARSDGRWRPRDCGSPPAVERTRPNGRMGRRRAVTQSHSRWSACCAPGRIRTYATASGGRCSIP
jgi:hypothetical protein